MSDWKKRTIERFSERYGAVPPPWFVFRESHPHQIGWRMGTGEAFIMAWGDWWKAQGFSPEQRIDYFRRWPPPARWLEWMISALWGTQEPCSTEDFDCDPYFERAEALGFGSREEYERDFDDPKWLNSEWICEDSMD